MLKILSLPRKSLRFLRNLWVTLDYQKKRKFLSLNFFPAWFGRTKKSFSVEAFLSISFSILVMDLLIFPLISQKNFWEILAKNICFHRQCLLYTLNTVYSIQIIYQYPSFANRLIKIAFEIAFLTRPFKMLSSFSHKSFGASLYNSTTLSVTSL